MEWDGRSREAEGGELVMGGSAGSVMEVEGMPVAVVLWS